MPRIPFGDWVNDTVDWLLEHMAWLFDFFKAIFEGTYDGINAVLQAPEPLLLAGIFAVIAFWLRGTSAGVLTFLGFAFIDSVELWEDAMVTLSLVLVATIIALAVAVPVGIWAARSDRVSNTVRPVLDFMQTLPHDDLPHPGDPVLRHRRPRGHRGHHDLRPGARRPDDGTGHPPGRQGTGRSRRRVRHHPGNTLLRIQLPLALP